MEKDKVVLIVDDNKGARILVKSAIEQAGFSPRILMTNSSKDALNIILSDRDNLSYPHLIFLDLSMPKSDGWDFLNELKALNLNKETKIVILTTSVNTEDQMKVYAFPNVISYCFKPITTKKIIEIFNIFERSL